MRIKSIQLCWFRGAAKIAELAPQGQSLVSSFPTLNGGGIIHSRRTQRGTSQVALTFGGLSFLP